MGKTALKTGLGFKACDGVNNALTLSVGVLGAALKNSHGFDAMTVAAATKFYEDAGAGWTKCWNMPLWQLSSPDSERIDGSGQWADLHFLRQSGTQVLSNLHHFCCVVSLMHKCLYMVGL